MTGVRPDVASVVVVAYDDVVVVDDDVVGLLLSTKLSMMDRNVEMGLTEI